MFRLRFSLKWFLLGTTLVGVLAGTFGKQIFDDWYLRQWLKRQKTVQKELISAGCEVQMTNGRVVEVSVPANAVSSRVMPLIAEAGELEQLSIYCEPSDADILPLGEHVKLRLLRLNGAATTDRSLAIIGSLPRLEDVSIYNSQLRDESLRHLRGYPKSAVGISSIRRP